MWNKRQTHYRATRYNTYNSKIYNFYFKVFHNWMVWNGKADLLIHLLLCKLVKLVLFPLDSVWILIVHRQSISLTFGIPRLPQEVKNILEQHLKETFHSTSAVVYGLLNPRISMLSIKAFKCMSVFQHNQANTACMDIDYFCLFILGIESKGEKASDKLQTSQLMAHWFYCAHLLIT